jgi:hypothetical protein
MEKTSMSNEGMYVAGALNAWKINVERADKLFSNLTSEQLEQRVAPGKNRLIYLWGHLTAVHDRMLPLLGLGEQMFPDLDQTFLVNPDTADGKMPTAAELKNAWNEINGRLVAGFAGWQAVEWLQKHNSVSAEDFAKDPQRNRFAILISRTNHLSYHLGQAIAAAK